MNKSRLNSCYVIGGDTLLTECVEILLQKDFDVRGIISKNPVIEQWAQNAGVPFVSLDSEYFVTLRQEPFDFLFSITHLEIIPEQVLALPEKFSINFHDGLLPRYAGLNAPAWALLNGEDQYGITWHVITAGVDEGDILLQENFDVSPDETSLSINTKCFASALNTFPALLDGLIHDEIEPQKQDATNRAYFGKFEKPEAAGVLDWTKPAAKLEAQIRALDFGVYPNPFACAKLVEGGNIFIVKSAVAQTADPSPGTVLRVEEGEIEIGTGDGSLTVTAIEEISGEEISISEFTKRLDIQPGKQLSTMSAELTNQLTELNSRLSRSEDFWINKLSKLEPVELPYASNISKDDANGRLGSVGLNLGADLGGYAGSQSELQFCAFVLLLARLCGKESIDLFYSDPALRHNAEISYSITSPVSLFGMDLNLEESLADLVSSVAGEINQIKEKGVWLKDLLHRHPILREKVNMHGGVEIPLGIATETRSNKFEPPKNALLTMVLMEDGSDARFIFDKNRFDTATIEKLCRQLDLVVQAIIEQPNSTISELRLLNKEEEIQILEDWNQTETDYPKDSLIHQLFEQQVVKTPESIALVFDDEELTYHQLNDRANQLANELVKKGVVPGTLVGVFVERSLELMVSTLGILKAGGAYVPLDPAFPANRIEYMIDDASMPVIVTQETLLSKLPNNNATSILVDGAEVLNQPRQQPLLPSALDASDLAYVIYTSGSTGKPKGVMVEHRNVSNFFTGMDAHIPHDPPGVWLAVTSLSFDISVLELFWTLARGFKVVIYRDRDRDQDNDFLQNVPHAIRHRPMEFGLFMWGNDDAPGRAKYRLMLEGAKFFDENGFNSIWTPERHFHAFGGPYPNPAVTGAAIAAITSNLNIRAGSCVSPLHHPIRIAEDWAVIDNLSNGRAALAFASGWQPNDFVIKPENHKNNKAVMLEQIEIVRKLWRGEKVEFENPMGEMVEVSTLPRPVQKELPVWVTTAGNPETYKQAGALGANILTHLLGQTVDELAEKIRLYRQARNEAGYDPDTGHVTLMLHTFVGEDNDSVRELVRQPMKDYLRSSMKLVLDFAWSFPAFKKPKGEDAKLEDIDIKSLSEEETETILDFAFDRYFENSGLFGTPDTCAAMVNRCKQADINEIACLLDYGVDTDSVMASLPYLKQVRDLANPIYDVDTNFSFATQVKTHNVTHLQCTPSMARMLSLSHESREVLPQIEHLMIGGEALPINLANDLAELPKSTLTNMYGPTETTIWSTTHKISAGSEDVPIGRPIANTKIYILDKFHQPTPVGVPGDLYIGGAGVVRGYLNRPELTAERFLKNPFSVSEHERIYWTGDLACYRENGVIDFLGRIDHQVKIRGYRIELGEIESLLDQRNDIKESVVILREDSPGDQRLVAYYVSRDQGVSSIVLRETLKNALPDYMIPSDFVALEALPLTPNAKVDRNALPSPQQIQPTRERDYVAPENELEQKIVELWQNTLKVDKVGTNDNFFDLGGHSLLIVRLHAELREALDQPVSLTDLYRFPTVSSIVGHLTSNESAETLKKSSDRAQRRREMTRQRRRRA